jgi:iron complex transport system ATP-binding protein
VSVSLDDSEILHALSFSMGRGRFIGMLGPNGSGKTTLLRTLAGLIPYRGLLRFVDRPVVEWRPRDLARKLAFVRQSASLSFDFSVSELILLGRSPHKSWLGDYSKSDRGRMNEALEMVDLAGFQDRSALSLSGGEMQRVFLAQAFVQEAEVLLLDEPTAHLDVQYQFEFMDLVVVQVRRGHTVVAVFHDLEMAARYADSVLVLLDGNLVAAGSPREVLSEDLIAGVFRMEARLDVCEGEPMRIRYLSALPRHVLE